ncbi:MAG TPA: DUF819 family protein [Bacteroidales bacterium]|nr:DUF819 family protein [Bacteroidales bacterium]
MINLFILIIFYVTFPALLIWLTRKSTFLKKLGAIVLAYALGIILGNVGLLPKGSEAFRDTLISSHRDVIPNTEMVEMVAAGTLTTRDISANNIKAIQNSVLTVIVPLAIPLLLFSLNIRRWLRYAGKGFLSMALALISVMVIVASGFYFFRDTIPECSKIAGLLIGVYTGGTPNMAGLSMALDVDPTAFIVATTYDMIVGAMVLIFFITAGPAFFRWLLPAFKGGNGDTVDAEKVGREVSAEFDDFSGMFRKGTLVPLVGALGIAILIFAVGAVVSMLLPNVPQMVSVILTITTLGIAASFVPWINRVKKTFQLGMYLIIAFSLIVASMADLSVMFQVKYLSLFLYVTYAYFGSLLLHLFLSWIFRVDADDYLITTTGFLYSPPFVPVVAAALKNKDVILTGLATGIIGYVLGNYIGVAFGMWLGYL